MKILTLIKELFQPYTVVDRVIKMLPDVDPDSTRMVEWIFFNRQKYNLDTYADKHTIHQLPTATMENLLAIVKPHFKNVYTSDKYFRGMLESTDGKYIELYCVMVRSDGGESSICCVGDEAKVNQIMKKIRETFRRIKAIQIDTLTGFSANGPSVATYEMSELDVDEPKQDFYPWLGEDLEAFIDRFNESKANVILLIGPPGTGKSTFIRKMLFRMDRKEIGMIDDANLQGNPAISSWVREFSKDSVVVFEDADLLVGKREEGNTQMSMLLNISNGVVYNNTKLIISTNLATISKVDPALLRPGRNFAVLEFRLLNADEANAARAAVGKEPIELEEGVGYTLAEALASDGVKDIKKRKAAPMRFK